MRVLLMQRGTVPSYEGLGLGQSVHMIVSTRKWGTLTLDMWTRSSDVCAQQPCHQALSDLC